MHCDFNNSIYILKFAMNRLNHYKYTHTMIRSIFSVFILLSFCTILRAQDPVFSQFYASPTLLNPAFTGSVGAPRINLQSRFQWPSFDAYKTYAASFDTYFRNVKSGLGLYIMSDIQGEGFISTSEIKGLYSYQLNMRNDWSVRFGTELGFGQKYYDWDKYVFLDQIDPITGSIGDQSLSEEARPESLQANYFDISSGILFASKTVYAGMSIRHMNRGNDGVILLNENRLSNGIPLMLSMQFGTQIDFNKGNKRNSDSFISPNVLIVKQGDFGQVNAGAYISSSFVFGGVWYRYSWTNADAAVFMVGVQSGILKIGYSYDYTVSALEAYSGGGAHEIAVSFRFDQSDYFKSRAKKYKSIDCLQLFR
jgi:type IX secretion system PorP/SprF family membrane protein